MVTEKYDHAFIKNVNIGQNTSFIQLSIGGGRYLQLGGGTDDGACVLTRGSGGMLPQKNF